MIFLLVAVAVVVAAPLIAAVLVTVASHREDSARTLAGRAPGVITGVARRLLCLRTSANAEPRRSAGLPADEQVFLSRAYPETPRPRPDAADQALTLPRP